MPWSGPILAFRSLPVQVAALAASLLSIVGCLAGPGTDPAQPGVLLVTIDSLRADRLGYAGHRKAGTSNIDALAQRGTIYANALTPAPEAPPAAASILTGQYPATHGVLTAEIDRLPSQALTLAELLRARGYRTGAFTGSILLHPKFGLDQGFDVYFSAFEEALTPSQMPEMGFQAQKLVDQAIEYLETVRGSPFFLWVNFFGPHSPYQPPEPFAIEYKDDVYQGEVACVDRELGRLLRKLEDWGIEQRTIIVLAALHGEGLGDQGEAYHGITLQAATTRVALVVAPRMDAGVRVTAPASLVDVAPTILSFLHAEVPPEMEGVPLTGTVDPQRPIYLRSQAPERLFGWAPLTGVVSGSWKYLAGQRGGLFDTASDPGETRDLASSEPAVRDRLGALASAYDAKAAAAARRPNPGAAAAIRSLGYDASPQPRASTDRRDLAAIGSDAQRAHHQFRRGSLQTAWFLFDAVLREDPDNLIALLDTALISGPRGQRDEARRRLERVRALYPDAAEVYHQLGHLIWSVEGEAGVRRARDHWKVAAMLDPLNEEAQYDAACALAMENRLGESLDALEKAIQAGFRDFAFMAADPDLDPIRSDPRFDAVTGGRARKETASPAGAASTK